MYQKDTDIFLKSVINYICEKLPRKTNMEELRYNTDLMIVDLENRRKVFSKRLFKR